VNVVANISPRPARLTAQLLTSARELAYWYEKEQARPGTAATIYNLVSEIEALREAAKGSLVVVNQAVSDKTLAQLKATTLLTVAEKIAPVIDDEIEQRQQSGCAEHWAALQALSDELHASIRLARG
jgi:hypothetical protein